MASTWKEAFKHIADGLLNKIDQSSYTDEHTDSAGDDNHIDEYRKAAKDNAILDEEMKGKEEADEEERVKIRKKTPWLIREKE